MELGHWSPAAPDGAESRASAEELLVSFDQLRAVRVMVVPAFFDEANKLRRFSLSVMRELDEAGIDSALPDWPGCNESRAPLTQQSLENWRSCALQAAEQFGATHTLSIRAGALIAPPNLPGWRYAPLEGAKMLSAMLRAQVIASREAGRGETREELMEQGRVQGLTLGGWTLGATFLQDLETATLPSPTVQTDIKQAQLGGAGLWLRAEPGESAEQAEALAKIIADQSGAFEEPSA